MLATVLIVGLTIAIAAFVFSFLKGTTELTAKKGESKFNADDEANVDFKITKCSSSSSDPKLSITIQNTGKKRIDCFWVSRVEPAGETTLHSFNIKEGDEKTMKLNGAGANEIKLYPCLIEKNKVKTGSIAVSATC